MSRVLITGSADGLGREAARLLAGAGHEVVLHGRSEARARDALAGVPGGAAALAGDLASIVQTTELADRANATGAFDAVIHNAGIGYRDRRRIATEDGLAQVFQANVLAPYLLTALVHPPARLVYLSSGLHRAGDPSLEDLQWTERPWDGYQAYCDSKLFDAVLAGAPGNLGPGAETQVWLATSDDPLALRSGGHFYHRELRQAHPSVSDGRVQDGLLAACQHLTGNAITP